MIFFCAQTCQYLTPNERTQTKKKEDHRCKKYDVVLRHNGHHPEIVRCSECKTRSTNILITIICRHNLSTECINDQSKIISIGSAEGE